MIEISLGTAVLIYGIAIAAGIAITWLLVEFSTDRAFTALEKQDLWRCDFCTFTYLDRSGLNMSRCPRCQSFNVKENAPAESPGAALEPIPATDGPRRNPSRRKRPGGGGRGPRRRR